MDVPEEEKESEQKEEEEGATIMFIFIWILVVLCIAAAIGLTVYFSVDYDGTARVVGLLITWLVCIAFCGLMLWALYGTESGKRAQKTLHSETSGGLNRTVKVYDMEGDLIAEYSGKFDVAESATEGITKVKFDCDGKRHIIYGSTGTIIIDEE